MSHIGLEPQRVGDLGSLSSGSQSHCSGRIMGLSFWVVGVGPWLGASMFMIEARSFGCWVFFFAVVGQLSARRNGRHYHGHRDVRCQQATLVHAQSS